MVLGGEAILSALPPLVGLVLFFSNGELHALASD